MNDTIDLATLPPLASGAHASIAEGACVMELVSYVAREPWSDHPQCTCPVIGVFLRSWNDALPDDEREALLRPLIPLVIGTRSTPAVEQRRATMAADWLIRDHTSAWLRLAGLTAHADALASLPEITDFAECPSLMPVLSAAARAAFWAAAEASEADWAAAVDATRDAHVAASDAAEAAHAAFAVFSAAAWDATRDAAWAAARGALNPTRSHLQQSALTLVHRMIAVTP